VCAQARPQKGFRISLLSAKLAGELKLIHV
jgi:hypothetical protein